MMTAGAGLYFVGGQLSGRLHGLMARGLTLSRDQSLDPNQILPMLSATSAEALLACVPLFGLIVLAALLAPLALGGWSFSTESLMPQFSRLNPIEGVKRLFSSRAIVELGKALAKFGIVGAIAVMLLWNSSGELLSLGREPTGAAIGHAIRLCGHALIWLSAGLLFIAGIDVPYQIWTYAKQLKMTREEVRQEMKESEGSPEIKGRIRQVQQQLARQRMMQDVPKADVVVTNPTHFAVALRYDDKNMRAPIVVAKGADAIAARIREIAGENQVPIFEAPPLARVLYRNVEIGEAIPSTVYVAVAQVLTYVFQLKAAIKSGAPKPDKPVVEVAE
jgi:flagellar biosynthetic protein FlhB